MLVKTFLLHPFLPNSEFTKNQALLISNFGKGGDFMERLSEVPQTVNPVKGTNPDSVNDPRFPKVVDRTKPAFMVSTVDGIAIAENPADRKRLDPIDVRSATAMSGGE